MQVIKFKEYYLYHKIRNVNMEFFVLVHYNAAFNYTISCIHPFLVQWPEETEFIAVIFLSLSPCFFLLLPPWPTFAALSVR